MMPNSDTSRPIILHPTEICATQLRRAVKPQFTKVWGQGVRHGDSAYSAHVNIPTPDGWQWVRCPFGKAGDQLWCKETYVIESNHYVASATEYPPPFSDGRPTHWQSDGESDYWQQCHYRATDEEPELHYGDLSEPHCRWRPPLTMPRWASRLTLELLLVRVERLQAITEEDAKAAGFDPAPVHGQWVTRSREEGGHWSARKPFSDAWDARNAAHPWSSNPYVWVLDVRRVN